MSLVSARSSDTELLCYDEPALDWERQALPIGNGRLGAMVLGAPDQVRLQFNVDSFWSGGLNPTGELDDENFGNYLAFGDVFITLEGIEGVRDYRRTLDLGRALHTVEFGAADGGRYVQEAFASHPAELLVLRLSSTSPEHLSGRIDLKGTHGESTALRVPDASLAGAHGAWGLSYAGSLANGLAYEAAVLVLVEGSAAKGCGDAIRFERASSLTLLLAAATNYALDSAQAFRRTRPSPSPGECFARALPLGYHELLREHEVDHRALFKRVTVSFGKSPRGVRAEPLDERIARYRPGRDPDLEAKLFQYGRYLLIASSRSGSLPANLQGIWNQDNNPAWHSDYHSNINTQMNYWLAEPAHLSECHEPLFDLLDATLPAARDAARREFGSAVRGFAYRTSQNIYGGQAWEWNATANAWYALHYFEHYAFTRDLGFLRARAWPYIEEASEFWLGRLKLTAEGRLVVPNGWSPEHGPREDGVSYDQELVWALFNAALAAARTLECDDPIVQRIAEAQSRLLVAGIGRWGQLQEWASDRDDPESHHRHTSHLIGVYPGTRVNLVATPELARAAAVSLEARGDTGDSRRSWTWPWRCALWSRLGAFHCHRMIDGLIEHNLLPNLITTHPPLQLDGNFGITAAICEMLLQSHTRELALLPGVDFARWPSGYFSGLRARGGIEVSARWALGAVTSASLRSSSGDPVLLRASPAPIAVETQSGRVLPLSAAAGLVSFTPEAKQLVHLRFPPAVSS